MIAKLTSIEHRILFFIIKYVAAYLWLWRFLKRHKTLRKSIVLGIIGAATILYLFGGAVFMTIAMMLLQFVYGFAFMAIQFIGLFWILSKPKTTEILPGDPKTVTFDDYWGNDFIVRLVKQWTSLMTDHQKFTQMGGRMIKGMMFVGDPGVGKTYLAEAMAGSSGVAFYAIGGGGFRGMFMGMDILRVMAFVNHGRKRAKEFGACYLYIEELDALGSRAGNSPGQVGMMGGMFGGGGMGAQALQRLLQEMDGIETVPLYDQCQNQVRRWFELPKIDQGVVMFIGSTNAPHLVDPALKRKGRFDKIIHFDKPDKASRRAIIEGCLGKIVHDSDIDVEALVQDTAGATPADLVSGIRGDAVRMALFRDREHVNQRDIQDALQEQAFGLENPISEMDPDQRLMTAIHEAAHALVTFYLRPDLRIVRVSIVRRADTLGYVMPAAKRDIYGMPLENYTRSIMVSLAGHLGVITVLGQPWTGGSADFAKMLERVRILAMYGSFGSFPTRPEEDPLKDPEINKAAHNYLSECIEATERLLRLHRAELDALYEALLEKEDLTGDEACAIIENNQAIIESWGERKKRCID